MPFIVYHAAVALLTAARLGAATERPIILSAVKTAKQRLGPGKASTDSFHVLDDAERELMKP